MGGRSQLRIPLLAFIFVGCVFFYVVIINAYKRLSGSNDGYVDTGCFWLEGRGFDSL